jgi:cell wall-associated NlpC family hydrolase
MRQVLAFMAAALAALPAVAAASAAKPALDNPKLQALSALGVKYRYGGNSPETGFDCSGLVAHVFEQAWGLVLPRRAREQASVGKPVRKLKELESGDLVFYNTRGAYSHVGIYIGDGRFIHAPRPGARVRTESIENPYWRARFNGARRLHPPSAMITTLIDRRDQGN